MCMALKEMSEIKINYVGHSTFIFIVCQ
jgi:hypothetical protein